MNVLNYDKQLELKNKRLAHVEAFVAGRCSLGRDKRVIGGAIYAAYLEFCSARKAKPMTVPEFYAQLDTQPGVIKVSGKSNRLFLGITILDEPERFKREAELFKEELDFELKGLSTLMLQQKLKAAVQTIAEEEVRISKLEPFLNRAESGDEFWRASRSRLLEQLEVSRTVVANAKQSIASLTELLRSRGEVPHG